MHRSNPIRRYATPAVAALVACSGAQAAPSQVRPAQDPPFIEVTGSGAVELDADRAHVSFAVETAARAADQAAAANAEQMEAVISALRSSDLQGIVIETFGYTLRPEYVFPGGDRTQPRTIAAYTAINNIRTTLGDVDAVGRLIDLAIASGANRVASISFSASDTDAARADALAEAVRDATEQARALADALGRSLGEALEVRGGGQIPAAGRQGFIMEAQAAVTTPIEPGAQTVRASVTIRFALGSGR